MPTLRTIYRAVVMIAAGVIVVKGWQFYGPSNEDVQGFGSRALAMAQAALSNRQSESTSAQLAADPRVAAQLSPATPPPESATPPPPLLGAMESPKPAGGAPPPLEASMETTPPAASGNADRLAVLMARLKELGADNSELMPWGASGQMYRFECRAALSDSPAYARHFEAVAAEPLAAVEQVLAHVEAWRTEQHQRAALE